MATVKILTALLLVTAAIAIDPLLCPRCDPRTCKTPKSCRGGLNSDACGCCLTCAKVLGEECAGFWYSKGRCDVGLECDNNPNDRGSIGRCREKRDKKTSKRKPSTVAGTA